MRGRAACAVGCWSFRCSPLGFHPTGFNLVTPIPASIARPLIDGLRNEVIVRDETARELFPQIEPMDYPSAVSLALADLEAHHIETSWSDAASDQPG